jgi:hypothetical protein
MEDLKTQKIHLAKDAHVEIENIVKHLKSSPGIVSVLYKDEANIIRVRYHLKEITLSKIEENILEFGAELRMGFWTRLFRSIKHYMETNERENLTAKPLPCCSRPDNILNKHQY